MGSVCAVLLIGALLAPTMAAACTIPIRSIGPLELLRTDLRRPTLHPATRTAWKLDDTWTSVTPELSQFVVTRKVGRHYGVSYKNQLALSIDARGPEDDGGWRYSDDDDPATPPCQITGQIEWQRPKVLVRQTRTAIRILAVAQRTLGDRTGCVYGAELGEVECPNLATVIVRLNAPVGNRRIHFERIAPSDGSAS
ncbi:MAG: hypothetical protein JWM90_634 [Thermoleophilia bacterium]|nr:hypothetical protein [Thermoleophilia bacterium]